MWKNIPFQPCELLCTGLHLVSVHENVMGYSQNDKSKAVGEELGEGISHPVVRNLKP